MLHQDAFHQFNSRQTRKQLKCKKAVENIRLINLNLAFNIIIITSQCASAYYFSLLNMRNAL